MNEENTSTSGLTAAEIGIGETDYTNTIPKMPLITTNEIVSDPMMSDTARFIQQDKKTAENEVIRNNDKAFGSFKGFSDVGSTALYGALEHNMIGKGMDWLEYRSSLEFDTEGTSWADQILNFSVSSHKKDNDFIDNLSIDTINQDVYNNGLPYSSVSRLMDAENGVHYQRILAGEIESSARNEYIAEHASPTRASAEAMGWVVADPTYFITPYLVPKIASSVAAVKSLSVVNTAFGRVSVGLASESVVNMMRSTIDKEHTETKAILDIGINGVLSVFAKANKRPQPNSQEAELPALPAPKKALPAPDGSSNPLSLVDDFDDISRTINGKGHNFKWREVDVPTAEASAAAAKTENIINASRAGGKAIPVGESGTFAHSTEDGARIVLDEGSKTELLANIEAETSNALEVIRNLDDVTSPAALRVIKDIEETYLDAISQVSKSHAEKIRYALDKKLGRTTKPKTYTEKDIARVNKKTAETKSQQNVKSNLKEIKNLFTKTIKPFEKLANEAGKKLKAKLGVADDALPVMQKTLDKARKAVQKQREKLRDYKTKAGRDKGVTKLRELNAKAKQLQAEIDKHIDDFATAENSMLQGTKAVLAKQKDIYTRVAGGIEEALYDMQVGLKDFIANANMSRSELNVFAKGISDDISDVLGHKVKVNIAEDGTLTVNKPITLKVNAHGEVRLGGKIVPLAFAMSLGTLTVASAGDGHTTSEIGVTIIGAMALILFLKGGGVAGGINIIKEGGKNIHKRWQTGTMMSNHADTPAGQFAEDLASNARTSFTESIQPILARGSAWSRDMIQRLGYNSVDGGYKAAERLKTMFVHKHINKYRIEHEIKNFDDWKKAEIEAGRLTEGIWEKMSAISGETKAQAMFRESVTMCRENPSACSNPIIKKTADAMKKTFDDITKEANEAGIHGFDDASIAAYANNYVPRLWNPTMIRSLIHEADDITPFRNKLIEMIKAGDRNKPIPQKGAESIADSMIQMWSKSGRGSRASVAEVKNIMNSLEDMGYDIGTVTPEDIIRNGYDYTEILSRAKKRILMDVSIFDTPITMYKNGVAFEIKLSDIAERNSYTLLERYARDVGAGVALKKATQTATHEGYSTESAIRRAVYANETDQAFLKIFDTHIDTLFNKALYDVGDPINKVVNTASNIASSVVMPLVSFSIGSEALKTFGLMMKSKAAWNELGPILNGTGKTIDTRTAMFKMIQEITGQASSSIRQDYKYRGIDDILGTAELSSDNSLLSAAHNFSVNAKAAVYRGSGMIKLTDKLAQVNAVMATERLAKLAHGQIKMSPQRMKRYGITQPFLDSMKNRLELVGAGELKSYDTALWTTREIDEFATVMDRMVMDKIQETTRGGTPLWLLSPVGRIYGTLLSFSLQSHSNHLVAGMKTRDSEELANQLLIFGGAYIGIQAKAELLGKELSDEDAISRAIFMMPATAAYGSVASLMRGNVVSGTTAVVGQNMTDLDYIFSGLE